jgi:predicted phosphodiesterase
VVQEKIEHANKNKTANCGGGIMGSNGPTITGQTALRYIEEYPTTSNKTLAGLMYQDNKSIFSSVDHARAIIRYWKGKTGDENRKCLSDKSKISENGLLNPFDALPDGKKELGDYEHIQLFGNKFLVIGDAHIPYHEKVPLQVALEAGYKEDVDSILINGDFADFYSVSFWEKDPRRRDFDEELETLKEVLGIIRSGFPTAKITYKLGNHEERYIRYMRVKAAELLRVKAFDFKYITGANQLGIDIVDNKGIMKIGSLHVGHGHEFAGSAQSPVNPARGFYLKAKDHFLGAHFHRPSHHAETGISSDFTGVWSIGCLCNRHPEYAPNNQWAWGFAIVHKYDNKEFAVYNKKIIKGRVYPA